VNEDPRTRKNRDEPHRDAWGASPAPWSAGGDAVSLSGWGWGCGWCGAGVDEAVFVGPDDGLDSVSESEFCEEVVDVAFDGGFADDEAAGDLVV
jgi:hypothetical protein